MEYQRVQLTCDPILKGYEIDTNGILYSKYNRPMKPSVNHNGYLIQAFNVEGKMIARSMHQLVAKQFIPNPETKRTVNHKNGNKQDNRVVNLEWATDKEQMNHASKVLHVLNPSNKIPIMGISTISDDIVSFPSISDAAKHFGVVRQSIDNVINGRKKSCCKFFWVRALPSQAETTFELLRIREKNKFAKHRQRKVGMFNKDNILIKTYPNAYSTRLDGFCYRTVNKCCSGNPHYKTYKGLIWKFLD